MCYCGVVAVGLMVSAFVVSGMVVRLVVEEPEMATISLTLPKSDYNRNLEFLSYLTYGLDVLIIVGLIGLSMERGFLSQKVSGVRTSVKERQVSSANNSGEGLGSYLTLFEVHGHACANKGDTNVVGNVNTPVGMSSYANVTYAPTISDRFNITAYGFFLEKRVAYLVVANYVRNTWGKYGLVKSMLTSSTEIFSFQFSFMDGLDAMLENGPCVPMTAFSEDGLSGIATKLGTPLMLDSYISDMCIQSWDRSSYARALIEVQDYVKLKDNIVVAIPKLVGGGDDCPKNKDSDVVPKRNNVNTSGNKKKDVKPTIDVSKSNSFDVLNLVENDVDLGTNGGTSNMTSKKLIINGTATLVDDEGKPMTRDDSLGDHDSEDEVVSVDKDMANFLASKDVGYGTNSLLEQWKESYGNGDYDYDPYDDDMYRPGYS
ncbi:hypothetical protein Tco_0015334 [Tanacetum coccineum]